jgi:AcrR family transcriptional regulator
MTGRDKMTVMVSRPRLGRPRHSAEGTGADASPRDQILDAAAALFVEHGFAATSTRMIAERVGIRQASLYYHFSGKDELLAELLTTSVRPSLDAVTAIEGLVPQGVSPAAALYQLASVDVQTLARTPHNVGTLYLLPEVQHEMYDEFRADRRQLQEAYGRLGTRAATGEVRAAVKVDQLGELLIQLTEVVIQIRRVREPTESDADVIAASCLRVCGLSETAIKKARKEASALKVGHMSTSSG